MPRTARPDLARPRLRHRFPALVPTLLAIALAAAFIAPSIAQAKCMAGNITAWPPPDTALPTRPMILLEGFGDDQPYIAALAAGGTARLVAGKRRVKLSLDALHVGGFGLTQAVLISPRALEAGRHYTLEVHGPSGKRVPITTWVDGASRPMGWTVARAPAGKLALRGGARVTGEDYTRFGCGPASHVEVSVPATSGAPLAVEVALTELGGAGAGHTRTYVVPLRDGQLRIGHGMCSGAFRVTGPERRFEAELTVLDAAGRSIAVRQPIAFGGVDPMGRFRGVKLR